jgi:hypothetical protein
VRGGIFIVTLLAASSSLYAWSPRSGDSAPTSGFTVDTSNRHDVVSFWHGVYAASDHYWDRVNWTGNYASTGGAAEGTTSSEFVDDVERRVNFVRALCGVPPVISMNTDAKVLIEASDTHTPSSSTTKRAAIQRSAFMAALGTNSSSLSHNPPSNLPGWTAAAWNGHSKGTISKGFYGPGAVDAYFREDVVGVSNWNYDVGHRRWLLAVPLTDMATGDTPGSFNPSTLQIIQPSNLIYVKPNPAELSSAAPRFVSYPAPGFFPVGLNTPYWSLSHGGADFESATVSMTSDSGASIPIEVVSRRTGYAENAIVWRVPSEVRALKANLDRTYHITVSGIGRAGATSHSWTVTLIDPDRLMDPLDLSGPDSFVASDGAEYQLTPVPGCDRMETGFFLRSEANWMESAEGELGSAIIDRTDSSYELRARVSQIAPGYASNFFTEGSRAFNLTFPRAYDPRLNSIDDEIFEIDRQIMAGPNARVSFQFRRGYMAPTTALACERTSDGGLTWEMVGAPLSGVGGGQADTAFSLISLPLAESSGPIQIRFRLYRTDPSAGFYDFQRYPGYATGVFIDELELEDCDWLQPGGFVDSAPGESVVEFGESTATLPITTGQEWCLRTRPVMGGKAFPWGPAKIVEPIGPLGISGNPEPPVSGSVYTFIPDPAADSHVFEVARLSEGSWVEGAETVPQPAVIDATPSAYDLISTRDGFQSSGSSSFRLDVQNSDDEDHFEIDREVVPTNSSELSFWLRRGWAGNRRLDAEISVDGGDSWSSIWSSTGDDYGDVVGATHTVDLSSFSGSPIRCRFILRSTGPGYNHATKSGMWLDEVGMSGVHDVFSAEATQVALGDEQVAFNGDTAGEALFEGATYRLRMVPVTGGVTGFPGPAFYVTPSAAGMTGYEAWVAYENPDITGGFEDVKGDRGVANGIKYAFGLDASITQIVGDQMRVSDESIMLERELDSLRDGVIYEAEASSDLNSWSTEGVTISHVDGVLRATTNRSAGKLFLRWKVTGE